MKPISDVAPMSSFADTIFKAKYAHQVNGRAEEWPETAARQAGCVVRPYLPDLEDRIRQKIEERKLMPGGRYLYAAGRKYPQVNNCFLFSAEDMREGWGRVTDNALNALMTGGGVGVVYSKIREYGSTISGLGGKCQGPMALMQIINEMGRHTEQGNSRRSAIWAGLHWNHPDVFKFIRIKDWSDEIHRLKRENFSFPATMDGTNISVILDDDFFDAYNNAGHRSNALAHDVYWETVRHMLSTGEPGFSVDCGENAGEHLRNACCEVTSRDNLDMCNLLSINMSRVDDLDEFTELVDLGTAFLICGTLYSKLPVSDMYAVREKNRRIGLGLMGVHDWLLRRGHRYEPTDELARWMGAYTMAGAFAHRYADRLSVSRPIATRSIAPTGTISIIGETTSGIEPVFAVAYKRRYQSNGEHKAQYVIDATAKKLVDAGVDPDLIEDAFTLAEDPERRIAFQGWMQRYVDHGISSTINLPEWGSSINNGDGVTAFGKTLMKHLPNVRGITAYPNGSRGGQPLTKVSYREAVKHVGVEFVDHSDESCRGGVCGI